MSTEINTKEVFEQAQADSLDKNGIITALITAGLDVLAAVREYNTLAREAGLTLTQEQKQAKIDEALDEVKDTLTTKEGIDDARDILTDLLDVAPTTAVSYIKKYADTNKIDLPIGQRKSLASKEEVCTYLIENRGGKKADLSKGLSDKFGYAKGTSDTITSMIGYFEEYAEQVSNIEKKEEV